MEITMWLQRKGNKYNNTKTDYNGILYDSKKEAAAAEALDWRVRAGELESWERQVRVSLDICPKCKRLCSLRCKFHRAERVSHVCNYYLDFLAHRTDGVDEWIEIKGWPTETFKLKWKLTEALIEGDETKQLILEI